ncbi:MAG: CerR family C-terminal domain-containing protein [Alphaproteobacteria bacterium]|nr:CerR family C-terminal domain-containing protein [Alphaproteobacteria bacterium]
MKVDTKAKILETALYEFATRGYDQTATRDILAKAKANVAAISYYFGNKKGLYIEVLSSIAAKIADAFKDLLPAYQALSKTKATPKECEELLKKFVRVFVELFCSDKKTTAMCMVFVREYVEPSRDFKPFFQDINADYRRIFVDLLIKANHNELTRKEAVLQVVMLFSFIFSLVTRKNIILDAMQWKEYSPKAVDELMSVISRGLFRK